MGKTVKPLPLQSKSPAPVHKSQSQTEHWTGAAVVERVGSLVRYRSAYEYGADGAGLDAELTRSVGFPPEDAGLAKCRKSSPKRKIPHKR